MIDIPKRKGVVNLPKSLIQRIDKLIEIGHLDYLSRDEFVRDACRSFLMEYVKLRMVD